MIITTTVILSITVIILFILCIVFIFMMVRFQITLINPKNCPQNSAAEFGVFPSTVGTSILDTCGVNSDQICTFTQVTSLDNAIEICHANANICSAFSYAASNLQQADGTFDGTMSIINYASGTANSTTYDTYLQQVSSSFV